MERGVRGRPDAVPPQAPDRAVRQHQPGRVHVRRRRAGGGTGSGEARGEAGRARAAGVHPGVARAVRDRGPAPGVRRGAGQQQLRVLVQGHAPGWPVGGGGEAVEGHERRRPGGLLRAHAPPRPPRARQPRPPRRLPL
ncbi:hypothetical protein BRADI_2g52121v3 [Brachypodium distachyon]|uniref:Uncharacterized protein n=1 Tax=Brachypodium distachyon TaxID=15368 RepID=A0A0Q3JCX4_BRADI|nr:hypothetical protein BRADI_2g52121v3 [Brachypodium distachyon]